MQRRVGVHSHRPIREIDRDKGDRGTVAHRPGAESRVLIEQWGTVAAIQMDDEVTMPEKTARIVYRFEGNTTGVAESAPNPEGGVGPVEGAARRRDRIDPAQEIAVPHAYARPAVDLKTDRVADV